MITLAIHSTSTVVARTLEAIATATGASIDEAAPYQLRYTEGEIALLQGETRLQSIPTPTSPASVARLIAHAAGAPLLGGWQFDATARKLSRADQSHMLTEKEALLLQLLLTAYPAPCPRDTLLKDGWGMHADIETHTLETHIYRLRHKLAELTPKPCDIVTVDSAYLLTMEPAQ